MFAKFNLKLGQDDYKNDYEYGKSIYDKSKEEFTTTLNKFINTDGVIDGTKLQQQWFPVEKSMMFFYHIRMLMRS